MIKACSNRQITMQVGKSTKELDIEKKNQMARVKKHEAMSKASTKNGSIYDDLEIVLSKTFDEDEKSVMQQ